MNQILLVAMLTLPNTGHVVFEVVSTHADQRSCEMERRQQQKIPQQVKTVYRCLPRDTV